MYSSTLVVAIHLMGLNTAIIGLDNAFSLALRHLASRPLASGSLTWLRQALYKI